MTGERRTPCSQIMIRRAKNTDIDRLNELLYQVQRLHAEVYPDIFKLGEKKYTTKELTAIIEDDNTPIFVYENEGVVLGYAFCIYQLTQENHQVYRRKVLYIDDLCVDNTCRRQGVGKKLYRYVVQTAAKNGCDSVTLNVWHRNEAALRFYESMGMKPLKTMMEEKLN